jgi:hypothetical protein
MDFVLGLFAGRIHFSKWLDDGANIRIGRDRLNVIIQYPEDSICIIELAATV